METRCDKWGGSNADVRCHQDRVHRLLGRLYTRGFFHTHEAAEGYSGSNEKRRMLIAYCIGGDSVKVGILAKVQDLGKLQELTKS